jgi:glycosyltransferase involved in cell wall biosynthesis
MRTEAATPSVRTVLFVGPMGFNPNSWQTRATYILPDLFAALGDGCEIHIVTGPVPDFARELMDMLCATFTVQHVEISKPDEYGPADTRWIKISEEAARRIRPDVVTNVFGSQVLGEAVCAGARACGARSVVRVAGDEIGSRKALGVYRQHSSRYENEVRAESAGLIGADTIIAMSPWEKERIAKIVGASQRDKIKVCIRGVDLAAFSPSSTRSDPPRRFLYVGRKSAEKGYDVIEAAAKLLVQELPDVEFIFVGDFEKGRVENRDYRGWVDSEDLPALFAEVDAFILSSRTEGFPQVVAEAMAAGLPCVLSEHLFSGVFSHGKDALLTALEPSELAAQIVRLAADATLSASLAKHSRELAEATLDKAYWTHRYAAVIHGCAFEEDTPFDAAGLAPKLRLLMIVPRPLGLLGMPGAYNLAEAFSRHTELLVICNSDSGNGSVPVVHKSADFLPVVEIDFSSEDLLGQLLASVERFAPDIVHVVNWHGWVKAVPYLKTYYPKPRYVIDIKTPLMQADGYKRDRLRYLGGQASAFVDLVVSRNTEDIDTWMDGNQAPFFVYPLGVAAGQLRPRSSPGEAPRQCKRFVYIGSLHEKRQLPTLIEYVAALPHELKSRFKLDIYGTGRELEALQKQIESYGLAGQVRLMGALSQDVLFPRLAEYDAGIAWVPRALYDAAPSIKFLEYAGSGLAVLATDTQAHCRNIEEGFKAELFSETPPSFAAAIRRCMDIGVPPADIAHNLELIKQFDWNSIVEHHFLPVYAHILNTTPHVAARTDGPGGHAENIMIEHTDDGLQVASAPVQFPVHWTPAVRPFHSTRGGATDTKVLGILSERLYYGLRDECRLLPLTEQGWPEQIADTAADFLLIESCLFSVLGDWHFAQGPKPSPALAALLDAARARKLPVVVWITADVLYADMYTELAKRGDVIFVADPRMQEYLHLAGCAGVEYLAPAVQPRIFNPLRPLMPESVDFSPYLIAGCGLPETHEEICKVIAAVPGKRFCGFERTHVPTQNYVKRLTQLLPNYTPFGRVSHRMLPEVLKQARLIITDARSRITPTEMDWQALENAACMCQTLRLNLSGMDSASPYIRDFADTGALTEYLASLPAHDIALEAQSQKLWRDVYSQNTFEQRLETINTKLGLRRPASPTLVASVISPTMRTEQVGQIVANFDRQRYAHKELIVVVNKDQQAYAEMQAALSHRPEIKVCLMPNDQYAASTLNLGVQASGGDYAFRFDDDDYYGEDYLSDSMLMLQADSADFLGKFASFVKINGQETVYVRRQANPDRSLKTYSAREFAHKDAAISGATFGVRTALLRKYPFPDVSLAAADTSYLELLRTKAPDARIVKTDCFGYTIGRDDDPTAHTWRVETSALIDKTRTVPDSNTEVPR